MTDAAPIPRGEAARSCPSCHASMPRRTFASRALNSRGVDLDICFDCQGIWFDPFESAQLSPAAILQLFELVRRQEAPPRPLAVTCTCPTCHRALALTHDFELTNRITYFRCTQGHGRFTTFMQFLREKNFVRTLSPAEINRLRATVAQVKCSSCGAPVDLARDMECSYCHAPIAILDPDAVGKTVAELNAAENARPKTVDAAAVLNGLLAGAHGEPPDLVRSALALVMDAITR